jgi:hypothetical protein
MNFQVCFVNPLTDFNETQDAASYMLQEYYHVVDFSSVIHLRA